MARCRLRNGAQTWDSGCTSHAISTPHSLPPPPPPPPTPPPPNMLEGRHLSIIVGNAHKELLEWAATQRAAHAGEVYVAQGHRAWGILEGLQRYGFKAA